MPRLGRRTFVAATTAALTAAMAPTILLGRTRAQTAGFGAAKHLVILFARGGLRSHAVFDAAAATVHNPHGVLPVGEGAQFPLGAVCGSEDLVVPSVASEPIAGLYRLTHEMAVLPCIAHDPRAERPVIDHDEAVQRLGTGSPSIGRPGLLATIGRHHPKYAAGFGLEALPPVEIGATSFGDGYGADSAVRPITFAGAHRPIGDGARIGEGFHTELRARLDERFRARRPSAYHERIDLVRHAKYGALEFAAKLLDPTLDVLGKPDASSGGFRNDALVALFGHYDTRDVGDFESHRSFGPDVALAVRLLQLGVPAIVVTRDMFDTHAGETRALGPRVHDLCRQLAVLRHVLSALTHPDGGSYYDHTVIAVVSEFSRNNGSERTGLNSGLGSDHVASRPEAVRLQTVPLFGGPIARGGAGGRRVGARDEAMRPVSEVRSVRDLHATWLDLLGIATPSDFGGAPIAELFG